MSEVRKPRCRYSHCEQPPVVFYGQERKVGLCVDHYELFDEALDVISEMGYSPKQETKVMRQHVLDWARYAGDSVISPTKAYRGEGWDD